ncbi:tRNA (adenosine(37)-N6)-threonylcarbamoyltransferase complex dimerization subunit type 1 TsaB [Pseudorhizobium flavum]|uniref:tRNA (adenosine(37)-N6)-threonylcarbamoyltransferase complex dimerization subunit type 1 TsaB n=1 Tax=Pseudorhizobium flavum TaxID=1335061 RepID=UPI00376FB2C9
MLLLAIDTAGADCSAAVYDTSSCKILGSVVDNIGKGHAERLMAAIDEALAQAGRPLSDVGRIAVVVGPGSFTGIRVGVAAARGLALSLGVQAVGVTTLEVLAHAFLDGGHSGPVVAAMDAKRGELYVQAFAADGNSLGEPQALPPQAARDLAASLSADLTGSGRDLAMGGEASAGADRFDISIIARLGAAKPLDAARPKPLYLRGPDAKPQTGYALARA